MTLPPLLFTWITSKRQPALFAVAFCTFCWKYDHLSCPSGLPRGIRVATGSVLLARFMRRSSGVLQALTSAFVVTMELHKQPTYAAGYLYVAVAKHYAQPWKNEQHRLPESMGSLRPDSPSSHGGVTGCPALLSPVGTTYVSC
jgi:hypothetical protein